MLKQFEVFYDDGVYYGAMAFENKTSIEIENLIQLEIGDNNKNVNSLYHIERNNFKEVL